MHKTHVAVRQKRVSRYGSSTVSGVEDLSTSNNSNLPPPQYAMFHGGNNGTSENEIRRRQGGTVASAILQKPVSTRKLDHNTIRKAEAVETSIAKVNFFLFRKEVFILFFMVIKMGKLFADVANLVMEQSEVLGRIEDDVEAGLDDTKVAYASITSAYEITKGNRGMILKIFALLVFFIFVFLVWT